jgi:hypothetical protein
VLYFLCEQLYLYSHSVWYEFILCWSIWPGYLLIHIISNRHTNWNDFRHLINQRLTLYVSLKTKEDIEAAVKFFSDTIQCLTVLSQCRYSKAVSYIIPAIHCNLPTSPESTTATFANATAVPPGPYKQCVTPPRRCQASWATP